MTYSEIEKNQDEICALCINQFYEGSVNTSQYDLCEGARCEEATEMFIEQSRDENIFRLEGIIRDVIKFNIKNKKRYELTTNRNRFN